MRALRWGSAAVAGSFALLLGVVVLLGGSPPAAAACGGPPVTVDPGKLPASVAGYTGEQLTNAAAIINAGHAGGVDAHGQTLGVMTALGESGLRVLDYGDTAGPDSRGLFQQRANGAWGSLADRMNPTTSATNFFHALLAVPGWEQLPPTLAAHAVQRNADPYYYEPFWAPAQQLVAALVGGPVTATTPAACNPTAAGNVPVGPGGWVKPAAGPVTSPYGWRTSPTRGVAELHSGTDLGAPCGAPIYAAAAGTVVRAGPSSGYGNLIAIDHGGGIVTRYAHMYNDGVLVRVGQTVTGGQQIAAVGANGDATACHLHFEVQLNDQFTDPEPFMVQHAAPLR